MPLLKLSNINSFYGGIQALNDINLEINEGEIVTLLGSNGAGKSTTLKTISSIIRPRSGTIEWNGTDIVGLPPHKVVELGIVHVPEGRRIFGGLTVIENLELGAYTFRKDKQWIKDGIERAFTLFPRLEERRSQLAGTLSGGEQQMVAIGRALMGDPKLLLLDEPSMGLAPIIVQEIMRTIKEINENGTTILLIEQNAQAALRLADRGYVIEIGNIVMNDTAEVLREDDAIIKAYLGM